MKKIIIAACAIAMTAVAQAGAAKWTTLTGLVAGGETTTMASGTLQLVAVAAGTSFDTVWTSVKDGTFSSVKDLAMTDGKIPATTMDITNGTYDFYAVCVDGDNFFISNAIANKTVGDVGTTSIQFSLKTQSNSGAFKDVDAGAAGAGWYQAVPEPTSGLLMLLGMAGLALRRRRA